MDVAFLSRLQFALTIGFHYIYPPLSIGLGVMLVAMEGMYLGTKNPIYQQMTKFFVRIFGLTFAVGVATGIVMEFEFGTNWAAYSRFVGDVFGSALAAEGIFAFFLESGSWRYSSSAGTRSALACTSWRRASCASAPTSAPSGSSSPIRGCKPRPAITWWWTPPAGLGPRSPISGR